MFRPSKRGWFVTLGVWACVMVAELILAASHALFDEQLAAAVHRLHDRYGAEWLAVAVAWAGENPTAAVVLVSAILVAGLYAVAFVQDKISPPQRQPFVDEKVEALAQEMNRFLIERKAMAPQVRITSSPSRAVMSINPNSAAIDDHDAATCRLFSARFDVRLREAIAELARHGIKDFELDGWSHSYVSRPEILDGIVGRLMMLSHRSKLSRLR